MLFYRSFDKASLTRITMPRGADTPRLADGVPDTNHSHRPARTANEQHNTNCREPTFQKQLKAFLASAFVEAGLFGLNPTKPEAITLFETGPTSGCQSMARMLNPKPLKP